MALAFFTILNTFLMNVGERRRQLAVLRAIGATRRQLIRMLLLEGLAMGVVGTRARLAAGTGRRLSADAVDGPGVFARPCRRCASRPAPFIAAGILGAVRLAAGDVRSGLDRRQNLAAGRHAVHRLRGPQPRLGDLHAGRRDRVPSSTGSVLAACILGYLPIQLMIVVGRDFHGGVRAVGADDAGPAGVARGDGAVSAASAPKDESPIGKSSAAASAPR